MGLNLLPHMLKFKYLLRLVLKRGLKFVCISNRHHNTMLKYLVDPKVSVVVVVVVVLMCYIK